jgi:hypothetical protein
VQIGETNEEGEQEETPTQEIKIVANDIIEDEEYYDEELDDEQAKQEK